MPKAYNTELGVDRFSAVIRDQITALAYAINDVSNSDMPDITVAKAQDIVERLQTSIEILALMVHEHGYPERTRKIPRKIGTVAEHIQKRR